MHPKLEQLGKRILVDGFQVIPDLERSHGSWVYDLNQDRELLDFGYNHFASSTLGYNHPGLLEDDDYRRRLEIVSRIRIALSDVYPEEYMDFVECFNRITPDAYGHFFFIDGGAPAVENSLKVAFDWKHRKQDRQGHHTGNKIMHFTRAFHGRLGYTLSLTNTADHNKTKFFPKFDWPRIPGPRMNFARDGSIATPGDLENTIAAIEEVLEHGNEDLAAILVEPIQGEGGDNYFPPEFFTYIRRVADENEMLLIFDEIQTGWATGDWWTAGRLTNGVLPDILIFGKKVQVCGLAVTDRIDDEDNVFKVSSRINSTWGGTLADMVRSMQMMEIITKDHLFDNSTKAGDRIMTALRKETDEHLVSNIRGIAGWVAFNLPDSETRDHLYSEILAADCLALKSGTHSIRLRLNLAITSDEIDKGLEILIGVLDKAQA